MSRSSVSVPPPVIPHPCFENNFQRLCTSFHTQFNECRVIKTEDSKTRTSIEDVKKKYAKAGEPEPVIVPMSPEVAAIIHGHLPEPWVKRALFVGPNYERLDAVLKQLEEQRQKSERSE